MEQVLDPDKFHQLGLNEDFLVLLVHSGSRGYGESIMDEHIQRYQYKGYIRMKIRLSLFVIFILSD